MAFATAFNVNAFQNNAFQINLLLDPPKDITGAAGIGAVAEPEGFIDFRKSDKAKAKREAAKAKDKAELRRIIHEAYYGKPVEQVAEFPDELLEEEIGPSEAVMEMARQLAAIPDQKQAYQLKQIQDRDALTMILLVT